MLLTKPYPYEARILEFEIFKDQSKQECLGYTNIQGRKEGRKLQEPVVTDLRVSKHCQPKVYRI